MHDRVRVRRRGLPLRSEVGRGRPQRGARLGEIAGCVLFRAVGVNRAVAVLAGAPPAMYVADGFLEPPGRGDRVEARGPACNARGTRVAASALETLG